MTTATTLEVTVHYPPAMKPYKADTPSTETVGQLKAQVLNAFGLSEGQTPDGNTVTYTLYHGKTPLENMSEALSEVAGQHKQIELKLSQQITQG